MQPCLSRRPFWGASCPTPGPKQEASSHPSWASSFLKTDSRSAPHNPSQSRARPWSSHMCRVMAGGWGWGLGGRGSLPRKGHCPEKKSSPPRTRFSLSSDLLWHIFPSPYAILTSKLQNFRGGNHLARLLLKGKGKPTSQAIKALPASQQQGLTMPVAHPAHVSSLKHPPFIFWMGPGPLYSPAAWPRPGRGGTGERIQPIIRTEGGRIPCFKAQNRPCVGTKHI